MPLHSPIMVNTQPLIDAIHSVCSGMWLSQSWHAGFLTIRSPNGRNLLLVFAKVEMP